MHHSHGRATLGGKLSAVLVAAGSSVGLGNIWRFPYVAGDNGGGAFLVIYILCVLLLGLPIMVAEFSVGRASHRNAVGAYRALDPKWSFLGYNGVVAAFLILGFYFVVSGWTAEYMVHSVTGSLARYTPADEYTSVFENFIHSLFSLPAMGHTGQTRRVIKKLIRFVFGKKTKVLRKIPQNTAYFFPLFHQIITANFYLPGSWFHKGYKNTH